MMKNIDLSLNFSVQIPQDASSDGVQVNITSEGIIEVRLVDGTLVASSEGDTRYNERIDEATSEVFGEWDDGDQ